MSFTVEHQTPFTTSTPVTNTRDEVDSSMYASASDNDDLVKEISKLEIEKRQHEQEVEELKVHNKKLVESHEALERKLDSLKEEKMADMKRLEKQIEDMADQLSKSKKLAVEENLNISGKLEEKNEEAITLKTLLNATQKELEQYKLLVEEKEELLQEKTIESKKQELKITELLGIQEAMVKEKNTLLDSQTKIVVELTNKLKVSTENIEIERIQRNMVDADKQSLEESLKELKAELSQEKEVCEHLKSQLEKCEKDKLNQLKSVDHEKDLELSRVEKEMSQQLLELQSTISHLRDEKVQLIAENSSFSDTINKLRIEIKEKKLQISSLELSVMDLNHKLHDVNERHSDMEKNYKNLLATKEQVVIELTKFHKDLNEKLQLETNKLNISEQKVDKLTALLKEQKENEIQLKETITKLETGVRENDKKVDSFTLQLKEAKESVASADRTQAEKIARYERDISLMKETNNKKVDTLLSQLKEYKEKSETQAKIIIQYESDVSRMKETNSKEFKEREAVIGEKQRIIEKLEEQNSILGMERLNK